MVEVLEAEEVAEAPIVEEEGLVAEAPVVEPVVEVEEEVVEKVEPVE